MATQVQFRRGSAGETAGFVGAFGESYCQHFAKYLRLFMMVSPQGASLCCVKMVPTWVSPLGSLSSCALKFASDPNTGLISPGSDQIALVTGGVARVTIDSSGTATFTGNVSIAGSLTVNGSFTSTDNIALIVALS